MEDVEKILVKSDVPPMLKVSPGKETQAYFL